MQTTNAPAAPANLKSAPPVSPMKPAAKVATVVTAKQPAKVLAKTKAASTAKPVPSTQSTASRKVAAKKVPAASKSAAAEKPAKIKKVKMVRDSFTFPKAEFAVLEDLKLRGAKLSAPIKKTELIRAGIKALAAMDNASFLVAIRAVPSLKTGRPAKG